MKKMKLFLIVVSIICMALCGGCSKKANNADNSYNYYLFVNKSEIYMEKGETESLVAVYGDDKSEIVFTSSDETVATVSQTGEITALSAGVAYIIVTAADDQKACMITVSEPKYVIELEYADVDYIKVNADLNINVFLFRDGVRYYDLVNWTVPSENCTLVSVDDDTFVFSATQAGEYTLIADSGKTSVEIILHVVA